ncbi:MAG: RNA-binding S4 domain-containing protein [Flavobacteriaceae bacterium]|nr:RNA-binding S4 domain-containing protein [Flavobacteriaceae bacterium]
MKTQKFQLAGGQEYIQLNNLLKLLQIAQTGGHAKLMIQNSEVKVNDEIETRVRKKLSKGDTIQIGQQLILIN